MKKRGESRTYKGGIRGIQEKNKCGGKKARKVRYSRRKRF